MTSTAGTATNVGGAAPERDSGADALAAHVRLELERHGLEWEDIEQALRYQSARTGVSEASHDRVMRLRRLWCVIGVCPTTRTPSERSLEKSSRFSASRSTRRPSIAPRSSSLRSSRGSSGWPCSWSSRTSCSGAHR